MVEVVVVVVEEEEEEEEEEPACLLPCRLCVLALSLLCCFGSLALIFMGLSLTKSTIDGAAWLPLAWTSEVQTSASMLNEMTHLTR